jgi:hypothetical protein
MLFYMYIFKFRVKAATLDVGFGYSSLTVVGEAGRVTAGLFTERNFSVGVVYASYYFLVFGILINWLNLFFFSDLFLISLNCAF